MNWHRLPQAGHVSILSEAFRRLRDTDNTEQIDKIAIIGNKLCAADSAIDKSKKK